MMDWYKVISHECTYFVGLLASPPNFHAFGSKHGVRSYNKFRKLVDKTFLRQHCIKLFQVIRSGIIHCDKTEMPVSHLDL